jgi:hypothetical protein
MNGNTQHEPKPLRMVFELSRADNPRLYDELVQFAQGAKRVNRLRVLAYDGLLAQHGVFALAAQGHAPIPVRSTAASGSAEVTNEVFQPGLAE